MDSENAKTAEEYLKLAQDAWQAQNFAVAHDYITSAVELNSADLMILELASWIELQFDIDRARELANRYLALKSNLSPPVNTENSTHPRILKTVLAKTGAGTPLISIVLPSRKLAHNDNQLEDLITSINTNTVNKNQIEIIIRIDDNDDIDFYQHVLEQLDPQISYKVISGNKGRGFRDTHIFLSEAYSFSSANTKVVIPCNDKVIFFIPQWDQLLLNRMFGHESHLYLVNITSSYHLRPSDKLQSGLLAYFTRPIPNLYAINRQFLDTLTSRIEHYGYGPFGSSYNIDVFLSLTSFTLSKATKGLSCSDALHLAMRHADAPGCLVSHSDRQLWSMLEYHDAVKNQLLINLDKAVTESMDLMRHSTIHVKSKDMVKTDVNGKIKRFVKFVKSNGKTLKLKSVIKRKIFNHTQLRNLFLALGKKNSDFYFHHCDNLIKQGNIPAALDFYATGNQIWLGETRLETSRVTKKEIANTTKLEYSNKIFSNQTDGGARISLVLGSRMRGNANSNLASFINSIVKTAADPSNIEVLISVDSDDDINKLVNILKSITAVSIKAYSNARGRGYYDLNIKYEALLNYLAPTSKILIVCSDDCYFSQPKWDETMLQKLAETPDEIAFFNLFLERDIYLGDYNLFTWWLFQRGPSTLFPSVSRKLLDIIHQHFLQDAEWSAFGHSIMMDSFFEMLRWHVWNESGENRFITIPNQIVRQIDNTTIAANTKKLALRFRDGLMLYSASLSSTYQDRLKAAAIKISNSMKKTV